MHAHTFVDTSVAMKVETVTTHICIKCIYLKHA
jgi:hypothetical protein